MKSGRLALVEELQRCRGLENASAEMAEDVRTLSGEPVRCKCDMNRLSPEIVLWRPLTNASERDSEQNMPM